MIRFREIGRQIFNVAQPIGEAVGETAGEAGRGVRRELEQINPTGTGRSLSTLLLGAWNTVFSVLKAPLGIARMTNWITGNPLSAICAAPVALLSIKLIMDIFNSFNKLKDLRQSEEAILNSTDEGTSKLPVLSLIGDIKNHHRIKLGISALVGLYCTHLAATNLGMLFSPFLTLPLLAIAWLFTKDSKHDTKTAALFDRIKNQSNINLKNYRIPQTANNIVPFQKKQQKALQPIPSLTQTPPPTPAPPPIPPQQPTVPQPAANNVVPFQQQPDQSTTPVTYVAKQINIGGAPQEGAQTTVNQKEVPVLAGSN